MALQDPHGDDLNPGQAHSDSLMGSAIDLNNAEKSATGPAGNASEASDIADAEETPDKGYINNYTGKNSNNSKIGGRFNFLKKKGPITGIIATLLFGGVGIGGIFSTGFLPLHLAEVMENKFNAQLTGMDIRSTKLLTKKMGTTKGLCTTKLTVMCKYSTMSEKQINNFKKAGIEVEFDPKVAPTLFGRTKPTGLKFDGKSISAADLNLEIAKNPKLRSAIKVAYNPRFAGFSDSIWKKIEAKFKISKSATNLDGDTDDDKLKSVQETTKGDIDPNEKAKRVSTDQDNPDTGKKYTADEVKAINAAADAADELVDEAADIAKSGIKSAPNTLVSGAVSTLKISGAMDNACTAYGTVQAVGYAAKTVRALQLARYAMIFLNVASQIKAGDAKPEDVSYVGKILTTEYAATKLAATDSFGYKYAAYGDRGTMSDTSSMFLAGGGLTGKLITVTAVINSVLGGTPKKTCKILGNPFVSAGSFIAGVGAFFVPGAQEFRIAQFAKDAAVSVGIAVAISFLPALLKDIIAGVLIDKDTVGEAAGDAITSGASGMMGAAANKGGNAPMTPQQAVAYSNMSKEILAQYAEEDRLTHSPLDITNSNTVMGSFFYRLVPYLTKMSSFTGAVNSITSLPIASLASITTPAKAASVEDYTMCQDFDYRDLNLATDPYCNVAYGLPAEALALDPIDVTKALLDANQIDEETGDAIPDSNYDKFIIECIDREKPIGDTDSNSIGDGAANCFYSESNKNYYVHYIDQRVQGGMDQDLEEMIGGGGDAASTGGSADPGDSSQPANTQKTNKGWALKDGVDYSATACADGSKDKGIYKHPVRKFTIRKCETVLGIVASIISQRSLNMVAAAKKDGVDLNGSGWRSYEEQATLWNRCAPNCNGMVAQPGNSNHEKGLAVDFHHNGRKLNTSDVEHKWLDNNGKKYGFINYPREAWHFSMSGG